MEEKTGKGIDAFFTGISILLVWFMLIFMLPRGIVIWIESIIAGGAVGWWTGSFLYRMMHGSPQDEISALHDILGKACKANLSLVELCHNLNDSCATLQAEIDRLMLEYCPEEMTPEQTARWEAYQKAVDPRKMN